MTRLSFCGVLVVMAVAATAGCSGRAGAPAPAPTSADAKEFLDNVNASAILDYFAPLKRWLDEQTKGKPIGW